MSPRLRLRQPGRREWTDAHIEFLRCGRDWFGEITWPSKVDWPMDQRDTWPGEEALAEIKACWTENRDELMAETANELWRPWAWWVFEQGLAPIDSPPTLSRHDEGEVLDRMGLLTPAALEKARQDEHCTRGILNEAHERLFHRRWGWWRFTSPERRDHDKLESAQLVEIERRGGEVLTGRERHIVQNKCDMPVYAKGRCAKLKLPRDVCDALGLPEEFVDTFWETHEVVREGGAIRIIERES